MKRKYQDDPGMQRSATAYLARVHDGTGDSGLAMHRPGFRHPAICGSATKRYFEAPAVLLCCSRLRLRKASLCTAAVRRLTMSRDTTDRRAWGLISDPDSYNGTGADISMLPASRILEST